MNVFLRRILQAAVVLLAVAALLFAMLRIVPGDPVATMMGEHYNADAIERMTKELGLDQPLPVQFWRYLTGALSGDFGTSYSLKKPVGELMTKALGNTVILAVFASLFAWVTGITCGVLAAAFKNKIPDRLFMGYSLLGISMPVFVTAMLLQYLFAFRLRMFDLTGTASLASFVLPAIALGWNASGSIARLMRSSLLDVMQEDYIDTARAKGRRNTGVILRHALRNAMLPVMTLMAMQFSGFLSGAVITETVFSINGIGQLTVQAISARDIPLMQGTVLFAVSLVILGNLAADSLYSVLDPRIRKEVRR